ncbi:TatD family hydrolase [Patescibacteria group bacterium]|nr:TatD family hydrolase [Patescibacteria group bacterium]
MILIDTHAHLNSAHFKEDLDEVIKAANVKGVSKIIVPGFSIETSKEAMRIANKYDCCYATIGIHPDDAIQWDDNLQKEYRALLSADSKIVAVGETGLDYHWDKYPRARQREVFVDHVKMATELDLPVVVHSREAEIECLEILSKENCGRAVFHCYGGDIQTARDIWLEGYYMSFTGNITYPKADDLREIVFECPIDKIMIETDAPYLAPQSKRGQRCEPADVALVFEKILEIKGGDSEELAKKIAQNSFDFFGIK